MTSNICLFEDPGTAGLLPLVYFRPVYNLKCGMTSLKEKIARSFPRAAVTLHCRSYLADYMRVRYPGTRVNEVVSGDTLFINGRLLIDAGVTNAISQNKLDDCLFVCGGELVAARISAKNLHRAKAQLGGFISLEGFGDLPRVEVPASLMAYPWHLVEHNGRELVSDFRLATSRKPRRRKAPAGVHMLRPADILIEEGAVVKPGCVLDAENGPIRISRGCLVMPNATITGPVHVGERSIIRARAVISGNTSIGPLCKVGGEVEGSIFQGYANKQHDGFLGHSYIGAWVNMGAGTNNSDLKNNYGLVRVTIGTEQIDTGLQFVGLIMGDHSKSAISSVFNAGTVVGVSSNIFGNGFPPKYVPSFSWGAAGETFTTFNADKAIDVARRVMVRRNVQLTAQEEQLFRTIFSLTSRERRKQGMPQ
jgi:UDP-N-acetylglucosamine diphosphorylase/glucosamine-1-phosphate N-acetyltransferase